MGHRIKSYAISLFRQTTALVLLFALVFSSVLPYQAIAWGEFTIKKEMELGKKFNVLVRSKMPIVHDPEVNNYVTGIVARLEKAMPPQPFPFTTSVIRHNAINAFACPGGYLFIHTGLILALEHESELAGVIAHEMAHVTQRHIAKRIEKGQLVSIFSMVGALAGAFLGGEAGSALFAGSLAGGQAAMLHYSRADEHEADQVGMNYLTKAGFSPYGMPNAFNILSKKQWLVGNTIPAYLSTHPDIQSRAHDMQQRIELLPAAIRKAPNHDEQFLRIQTLVRAKYSDANVALRYFNNQKDPDLIPLALMGKGIISSRQNRINDASQAFAAALEQTPNDQLIIREAGIFHYTKGNRKLGQELLQQAIKQNPKDIMGLFYYSKSLADGGQTRKAISVMQEVLRFVPEDSEVNEQLARLYGQNNEMFKANLYMAYSGLYENSDNKVTKFLNIAKGLAVSPAEKQQLDRFQNIYNERKEFW